MPAVTSPRSLALSCIVALTIAGCASSGGESRDNLDSTIAIHYGTVTTVTPVKLQSDATRNATVGGLIGLLSQARGSGTERLIGAAVGAAVGGLATKAAEGDNMANSFVIELARGGGTVKVVTEQQNIAVGDCVAVETGRHTNLRRVSQVQCSTPRQAHPTIDLQISQHEQSEANACDQAKEELLKAKTEADINALTRKVQVICDH